jgi:hypothetical protein
MSYSIRREFSPDRGAIVFEFDAQSEDELMRDFPWLKDIGAYAFGRHRDKDEIGDLVATLKARTEWACRMRGVNPVPLMGAQPPRKTARWQRRIARLRDAIRSRLNRVCPPRRTNQ